jgi:hypothetical protein
MKAEVFAHLTQRITSTSTKTDPYHHFHAEQIFPEEFYCELIENIPDISYFSQLDGYPQRSCFALLKEKLEQLPFTSFLFWHNFITSISGLSFANALLKKFQPQLKKRFGENIPLTKMGVDLSLIRDQAGYSIGPHTDHPSKILTLIFYLPLSQEQNHLGTSIYIPKDGSRKYSGHEHHSFKEFDKVSTIPFVPNSVFGFLRSDCSFHGVEPIQTQEKERISLCYTIWEQK